MNSRYCRYDGQTFVKPPEVLARDRLLGSYEVGSCTLCSTWSVVSCHVFCVPSWIADYVIVDSIGAIPRAAKVQLASCR